MLNQPTTPPQVSKLHLGQPKIFDRFASKANAWLDSVQIYLLINNAIYTNDAKKIAFTLSFMKEGSAATWASTTTKKALAYNSPNLGTWADFFSNFKTSFIHTNVKNESITWLTTTLVSKTLPLRDYISQFKNHIALSTITNEDALINFFLRGIPIPLMKRIYTMDTVPTKVDDWYTHTMHFKTHWDRADAITHKHPYNPYPTQKHTQNHQTQPKDDPYAMDVNSIHLEKITKEEREKYIREGVLWS